MHRHQFSIIAAAICIGLSGCSTQSLERTDEARQATQSALPTLPEKWSSEIQNSNVNELGWLANLNSPLLTELVAEGLVHNNNLIATASHVDGAQALYLQASSAMSPQVGLSLGSTSGGALEGSGSNSFNVGVQASWEADLWGRLRSGNIAARESLAAAQADFEFAKQSLAANVARAYLIAVEAEKQLELAKLSVGTVEETLRIVQVQYDNGLSDEQNLSLVKSDFASAQESLASSEAGVRDAKRALELLLGRYPSAEITLDTQLPEAQITPPIGLPSDLLERRPDLIAAERRVAAAFNRVDQAKAAKLPNLSLSTSVGGSTPSLSNILNPANLAWQAASSLVTPLIDGGRLDAQVDAATAEQKAAVASYAQAALTAFGDVEQALDQGVVLQRRIALLETALKEAENAERIARLQFDEGEIALLDVLTIQQRVFSARRNVLSLKRTQVAQYIDLNLALGGSWD